jgi:hypothetical protein
MMTNTRPKLLIVEDDEGLQAQLKWAYDDFEVHMVGDRPSAICRAARRGARRGHARPWPAA